MEKIARELSSCGRCRFGRMQRVEVTDSATLILSPSPGRVRLLFSPHSTTVITLSTDPSISFDEGLQVIAQPLEITLEGHGDIVQKAWYAVIETAVPGEPVRMGVLETIEG